jgi:hypothetical protein
MSLRHCIFVVALLYHSHGIAVEEPKTYKGFLVIAPEAESFRPCGSATYLWLDYELESTRHPIAKRYRELATTPYEETYAVLIGTIGPKLDCGFCDSYEGSFEVKKAVEQRRVTSQVCK